MALGLRMSVHLGGAAAVPGGEVPAALSAAVLDVLGAFDQVRKAAKAAEAADAKGPGAVIASQNFVFNPQHSIYVYWRTAKRPTYCVVLPVLNVVVVNARVPQAGQSTGAAERCRLASGVALRYCESPPMGCCPTKVLAGFGMA